jgi:hypothetical protein
MHSRTELFAVILGVVLCLVPLTRAQDETSSPKEQSAPKQDTNSAPKTSPSQRPASAYHLDFSLYELEDGKKLNTRRYSMNLTDAESEVGGQDLKIVTRAPIQSENGKFEYLDIGTTIRARIIHWTTPVILDVNADISSFASSDEATKGGHPLLREMRIGASTVLTLNKPMIIGSVDDPNSKREYQLELTVTKLQ